MKLDSTLSAGKLALMEGLTLKRLLLSAYVYQCKKQKQQQKLPTSCKWVMNVSKIYKKCYNYYSENQAKISHVNGISGEGTAL